MPETALSKESEAYVQEIEEALATKSFHRFFNSRFIDCKDFYDLPKADQEKIRKAMNELANSLACYSGDMLTNNIYHRQDSLFTEKNIQEAP